MPIELLVTFAVFVLWVLAFNFRKKHPAAALRSVALFGLSALVSALAFWLWFWAWR